MKILIASGGSGGHIFPAVALARTLKDKNPDVEITFVGSNKVLDKRILEKEGFRFRLLSSNKLPYRMTLYSGPEFFMKLAFDFMRSFFIVASYRPDITVSFGGYVSVPICIVSKIFGIPMIAHEQNVVPGRANHFVFKLADEIAISFEETREFLGADSKRATFTGNPIRATNNKESEEEAFRLFGLDRDKFTILVIGGSQGSHILNESFLDTLSGLDEKIRASLQVIHIAGLKDYEHVLKRYEDLGLEHRVYSFIDRIEEAYSASDLVVTRSGASAIFETAFFGRPMILIPYRFAMSHQAENARVFSRNGAAIEIDERNLSGEVLKGEILGIVNDSKRLDEMAQSAKGLSVPGASENLAERIFLILKKS